MQPAVLHISLHPQAASWHQDSVGADCLIVKAQNGVTCIIPNTYWHLSQDDFTDTIYHDDTGLSFWGGRQAECMLKGMCTQYELLFHLCRSSTQQRHACFCYKAKAMNASPVMRKPTEAACMLLPDNLNACMCSLCLTGG